MSFLEKMQKRYTTKMYDPSKKLTDAQIVEIQEILRLSPSSINSQPWQFNIIKSESLKVRLAQYSQHNTPKVTDCSHLVVMNIIDDVDLFLEKAKTQMVSYQLDYFKNQILAKGDDYMASWMKSQVYIALGVLLSACADMQIDATPMEGIDKEKYTEVLGLKSYKTILAVALGKRHVKDQNQPQLTPKKRLDDVVTLN